MMKRLLIATRNKGKFPEIISELEGLSFEILSVNDVPSLAPDFEVEESAMTFEGNAIIKAVRYGNATGFLTLAEDSGLEVDALLGRPGVYSARYAPGTAEDRYRKLLGELCDVPDEARHARLRTVVAIYDPASGKIRTCEGVYAGMIAREPRGINGFGYDPVFWNETLKKTNAEMTLEEKNTVSHRGIALRNAREILEEEFL